MEVYLVEQDNMKRVTESELDQEANLEQRLVRTDGAKIGDVEVLYVGRQGSPGEGGIFDILGVDERGDTVVVELKRGRTPRKVVAQALEYAGEIRNVDYDYLDERYSEFLRDEQGYTDPGDIPSLRQAHREYFDLEEPLSEREFNDDQRLVVVGTDFSDVVLNMADFLRENGIDVVAVEYSTYRDDEEGVELLTTDGVRRPLSEEPSTASSRSESADYSTLTDEIRDRVDARVRERDGVEEVRSTPTQVRVVSAYPPGLQYQVYIPGTQAGEQANLRVNITEVSTEQVEHVQSVLAARTDEEEMYTEEDNPSRVVQRDPPITISEKDADTVEEIADELVSLVEWYHPKLVEEVGSE
jgi:hypothetical protein